MFSNLQSIRPPMSRVRRRSSSFSVEDGRMGSKSSSSFEGEGGEGEGEREMGACSDGQPTRVKWDRRMRKRCRKDPRVSSRRSPHDERLNSAHLTNLHSHRHPQQTSPPKSPHPNSFESDFETRSSTRPRSPFAAYQFPPQSTATVTAAGTSSSLSLHPIHSSPRRHRTSIESSLSSSPSTSTFTPSLVTGSTSTYSDSSISAPSTPPSNHASLPFRPVATASEFHPFGGFTMSGSKDVLMESSSTNVRCAGDEDEQEVKRLHHLAFEKLREETDRDGEGFVERLKRWEESRTKAAAGQALASCPEQDFADAEDEDDDDELEVVTFDQEDAKGRNQRPPPIQFDVEDLVARLSGESLDDFAAVREFQSRCS
ncbi:hypothetical protein P7C70_g3536, partial [Phenoliferia sp. Uapishka_3]